MKRLLVTGGSGLLGLNWACCMRDRYQVVLAVHHRTAALANVESTELPLESTKQLSERLTDLAPDLIVHAAGMTSVDQCERRPALAEMANTTLAENVALAAFELGINLIHISTDHLFSGAHPLVSESELPEPMNVYARTKRAAESLVSQAYPGALIVRTNFFGWGHAYRQSFSDWIIYSLRSGRQINMFDDVFFTPILADDLALAAHEVVDCGGRGIYNIVGDERISKFAFAEKVAERFGLPRHLITRSRIARAELSAARPQDMSLSNEKLTKLVGRKIGSLDYFLDRLHQQEAHGRAQELMAAVSEA